MKGSRGQSLVELAVCLPVVLALGLGAAAVVRVVDAHSGLQAATEAAVGTGARQSNPADAVAAARARFRSLVAAYPLRSATLTLDVGDFRRGATISASASAWVDIGWPSMTLPSEVELHADATAGVDAWRSRPRS